MKLSSLLNPIKHCFTSQSAHCACCFLGQLLCAAVGLTGTAVVFPNLSENPDEPGMEVGICTEVKENELASNEMI